MNLPLQTSRTSVRYLRRVLVLLKPCANTSESCHGPKGLTKNSLRVTMFPIWIPFSDRPLLFDLSYGRWEASTLREDVQNKQIEEFRGEFATQTGLSGKWLMLVVISRNGVGECRWDCFQGGATQQMERRHIRLEEEDRVRCQPEAWCRIDL